jgi:Tol biopolymer transport system component
MIGRVRGLLVSVVSASACGFSPAMLASDAPDPPLSDGPGSSDPGPAWGAPTELFVDTGDHDPTLTGDMLELYFDDGSDIWLTARTNTSATWSAATQVTALDTTSIERTPEISRDGLTMYFASNRSVGDDTQIWVSTRQTSTMPWTTPMLVTSLGSTHTDCSSAPSADGATMVLNWDEQESHDDDIYESTRSGVSWTEPAALASVNSSFDDDNPMLSDDELSLYFDSDRSGDGHHHLYMATRSSPGAMFGTPVQLDETNPFSDERAPWISSDGHTLVFESNGMIYGVSR